MSSESIQQCKRLLGRSRFPLTPFFTMYLHLYADRVEVGTFRGTRTQCERIARQVQQLPVTPVLAAETGYSPSQLAVLRDMADSQEAAFLAGLEAGLIAEPAHA